MKECTYLTCNRPSDSWENAKKSELQKMAKGRVGERGRKNIFSSSHSLPLTLFHFCFPPFSIWRRCPLSTVHYTWNRLVHSGPESFLQCCCKGSIDVHLGAFDIFKAHTHAATIPALALVKRHFFFSIFRFAVEESFWRFVPDDSASSSIETS